VATFNFAAHGENTMVYNKAQQEVTANYTGLMVASHADQMAANYADQVELSGGDPTSAAVKGETDYYRTNIGKVKSIDDLLKDDRLLNYVLKAYGLDRSTVYKNYARALLEGGISDPNSPANTATDPRLKAFVGAFAPLELTGGAQGSQTETGYYL